MLYFSFRPKSIADAPIATTVKEFAFISDTEISLFFMLLLMFGVFFSILELDLVAVSFLEKTFFYSFSVLFSLLNAAFNSSQACTQTLSS
jgi:hypothetical protein